MAESASNPEDDSCNSWQGRERRVHVLDDIARKFENSIAFQKAVYRIANLANTAENMQAFYRDVHAIVNELTSAENLFIALIDEENEKVTFPYYIDGDLKEYPFESLTLDEIERLTISSLIIETRKPVHLSYSEIKALKSSRGIDPQVGGIPQDWMGVPLLQGDQLLGALVLQSYEAGFRYSEQDETLLTHIGQHVATALRRKHFTESLREAHDQLKSKNEELEKGSAVFARTNANLKRLLKDRKSIQKQLAHNASHDALTDLPNRTLFLANLKSVIEQAKLDPELEFAVLFLDLDRFKVVNDCLGHLVGDALLKEVAGRLRACVRPTDVVARLGGDEFCVLLCEGATDEVIDRVANRILENLSRPVSLGNQRVVTSTSIGITIGGLGYHNAEDMLRDADTALYQVKANGKSNFQIFNQSMREKAVSRLEMEQALRLAIEENDISVHYQPIVDIKTGQIVSFEALARWNHPQFGTVPAGRFIAIAEEIHLVAKLTEQVMRKSAEQVCQWRTEIRGLENLSLNVNISSRQIENGNCVETISNILERVKLPPENLKLEVTESLLLNNVEMATEVLNQLNDMKIRLALDDFGTGYSSLACLNSLPLHELKIDLSFVRNIVTEPRSHAIVQMIVALADVMNLKVVAEGIENEAQLTILRDLKVDQAQGFLFGQPASATSITKTLVQAANPASGVFTGDLLDHVIGNPPLPNAVDR